MIEESEHLQLTVRLTRLFYSSDKLYWTSLEMNWRFQIIAHRSRLNANMFMLMVFRSSELLNLLQWSVWLDDCDVRCVSTWSQRWDSLTDNETRVCESSSRGFNTMKSWRRNVIYMHIYIYIYSALIAHLCCLFHTVCSNINFLCKGMQSFLLFQINS